MRKRGSGSVATCKQTSLLQQNLVKGTGVTEKGLLLRCYLHQCCSGHGTTDRYDLEIVPMTEAGRVQAVRQI